MKIKLLFLSICVNCISFNQLFAQNFVTFWDLSIAGSGNNQISFDVSTSGIVNYSWEEMTTGFASGSGSFSDSTLTITNLPIGSKIILNIEPKNFDRVIFSKSKDKNRLLMIESWGTIEWKSMEKAFKGCENLKVTALDVPNLKYVESLNEMFFGCTSL